MKYEILDVLFRRSLPENPEFPSIWVDGMNSCRSVMTDGAPRTPGGPLE